MAPCFPLDRSCRVHWLYTRLFLLYMSYPRIESHRFDKSNVVVGCKTDTNKIVLSTVSLKENLNCHLALVLFASLISIGYDWNENPLKQRKKTLSSRMEKACSFMKSLSPGGHMSTSRVYEPIYTVKNMYI